MKALSVTGTESTTSAPEAGPPRGRRRNRARPRVGPEDTASRPTGAPGHRVRAGVDVPSSGPRWSARWGRRGSVAGQGGRGAAGGRERGPPATRRPVRDPIPGSDRAPPLEVCADPAGRDDEPV